MSEHWAFLPPLLILFVWNFVAMRYFVYGRPLTGIREQFIRYSASALVFRGAEFFAYWLLVSQCRMHYLLVMAIVMPVSFVMKFLIYRMLVFASCPYAFSPDVSLSDQDITRLAELHLQSLPTSIVAQMGLAYTRSFYRYVQHSEEEILLVRRIDGAIVSGCVVSTAPQSLIKRLILHTPLLLAVVARATRLPWRAMLFKTSTPNQCAEDVSSLPEVLLLFISPSMRGNGIGLELLRESENRLAALGKTRYMLKTIDDPENPAFFLYAKHGLKKCHTIHKGGRRYRVWTKSLEFLP